MSPPDGRTLYPFADAEDLSADEQDAPQPCEVAGRIKGPAPDEATVRGFLTTLQGGALQEQPIGQATVDEAGWYRIPYERPLATDSSDTTLTVRLYASGDEPIAESTPLLRPAPRARIDIRVRRALRGPSEYALL